MQLNVGGTNTHAGLGELPAGYYAVLEVEQVLAWAGEVGGHH